MGNTRTVIWLVLCLVGQAHAADWYVGPSSGEYGLEDGTSLENQFDGCADISGIAAGDTIYFDTSQTWYERCALTGIASGASKVTYTTTGGVANFDHTVSIDGTASFTAATTYSASGGAWSLAGGEVYKKNFAAVTWQMTEDGVDLTPKLFWTDSEATIVAGLGRGQFTIRDAATDVLYYRASDGAAPSTHALRVNDRRDNANQGLLYCDAQNNIKLRNVALKHHRNSGGDSVTTDSALSLVNCNNIDIDDVDVTYNGIGVGVDGGSVVFGDGVNVSYNLGSGVAVEGDTSVAYVTAAGGEYNHNSNSPMYGTDPSTLAYPGDGDGWGIGHDGGTAHVLLTGGLNSNFNGAPDGDSDLGGAGIYFGTSETFTGTLSIEGATTAYNHGAGIELTSDWSGGNISGWLSIGNRRDGGSSSSNSINIGGSYSGLYSFAGNVIAYNCGTTGLTISNADADKFARLHDSVFIGNAGCLGTTFISDLLISNSNNNLYESHNVFWSATSNAPIKRGATTYTQAQINGGTWDAVSTILGASTTAQDPLFDTDESINADRTSAVFSAEHYRAGSGSPLPDSGVYASPLRTVYGARFLGTPDIGVHQNQSVPYGYSLPPNKRARR